MAQYRKKPVVIEAMQWDGTIEHAVEVRKWAHHQIMVHPDEPLKLVVPTLEGQMNISPGDYIVCGVKGEFYAVKPDIFEMTYDKVEDGKLGMSDYMKMGGVTLL